MNAINTTICAGLLLASLAGGAPLRAGEVGRESALQINQANELLRDGDVNGAIGAYEAAREFAPDSADLSYNMAVAKYRQGDVAAAEPLFQAAAASENDSLAARSRYNLGNCDYTTGLQLAEKDRPAAIEKLESAIANYRSSLAVDSNDADARANIELASQLIEKLKEEQKQQEQQQNQQDQQQQDQQHKSDDPQQNGQQGQQDNQQQQDQQQKDSQQQQNEEQQKQDERQKSDSSQGDQGQDQQSQQDQQSEQDKSQQDQPELSKDEQVEQSKQDESQQNQSQSESQSHQDSDKESQQQPQTPQQRQQQANKSPQQNPTTPGEEPSEEQGKSAPQGELSAASEKKADDEQKREQVTAFDPSKDGEMTQQEAEKMLQAIRDRDMLRRLRQQRSERNQYVPVDRDW